MKNIIISEITMIVIYLIGIIIVLLIQLKFLNKIKDTGPYHQWKPDALTVGQFGSWVTLILLISLSLIIWFRKKFHKHS